MTAANAPMKAVNLDNERHANEPSMEEILASIRKIIADDEALPSSRSTPEPHTAFPPPHIFGKMTPVETAAPPVQTSGFLAAFEQQSPVGAVTPRAETPAAAAPSAAPTLGPAPVVSVQSVELDESELASFQEIAQELSGERGPRPVIEAVETVSVELAPEPLEDTEMHDAPPAERGEFVPQPQPRLSVSSPLSEPDMMLSTQADASISSAFRALSASVQLTNSDMIDRHVRDLLRPMLKQWLDDNLPVMVERLVRAEIERVARGGR
jgi:uncharacterized protein